MWYMVGSWNGILLCFLTVFDQSYCLTASWKKWSLTINQKWRSCIQLNKISELNVSKKFSFSLLLIWAIFDKMVGCLAVRHSWMMWYCVTFTLSIISPSFFSRRQIDRRKKIRRIKLLSEVVMSDAKETISLSWSNVFSKLCQYENATFVRFRL